jgi:hypothetical protein
VNLCVTHWGKMPHVGHLANLYVTHWGKMHLTLTCEIRDSQIIQHVLDSLRIATVTCYLVSDSRVFFFHDFSSVTLLFSDTLILVV